MITYNIIPGNGHVLVLLYLVGLCSNKSVECNGPHSQSSSFELNTAVKQNQPQPRARHYCRRAVSSTRLTSNQDYDSLHTTRGSSAVTIPTRTHKWLTDDCSRLLLLSVYQYQFLVTLYIANNSASSGCEFGIKSANRGMSNSRRLKKKERRHAFVKHTGSHPSNDPGTLIKRSLSLHQSWCSSRSPGRTKKQDAERRMQLPFRRARASCIVKTPHVRATPKSASLTMMTWGWVSSAG